MKDRRIGILRIGSMGDHLITLPLYRKIRETHPSATLVLISNLPAPGNSKLIGPASLLPESLFDEIHNYPVGRNWGAVREKIRLFRTMRLNTLYYMMPHRSVLQLWRDRLFFLLAGATVVGMGSSESMRSARSVDASGRVEHELDRLARLVPLAVSKTPRDLSIDLTEDERAAARNLLYGASAGTVVISIGTKLHVNEWGVDRWTELVSRLADIPEVDRLVLIGAADEYPLSEVLRKKWPRESKNLCGLLSPRGSAAVLAEASLFIGHDSGPMHMAAAVDVPIVAIFSSRNPPGMWFPLSEKKRVHYSIIECMGCGRLKCDDLQKECIRRISVQEVYESCVAALDGRAFA